MLTLRLCSSAGDRVDDGAAAKEDPKRARDEAIAPEHQLVVAPTERLPHEVRAFPALCCSDAPCSVAAWAGGTVDGGSGASALLSAFGFPALSGAAAPPA